jgi:hypothetical protein
MGGGGSMDLVCIVEWFAVGCLLWFMIWGVNRVWLAFKSIVS